MIRAVKKWAKRVLGVSKADSGIPRAFHDEIEAVNAGCKKYRASDSIFAMRRDIHRIEKGLSHIPRRVFALGYIDSTVERLESILQTHESDAELAWFQQVLLEYFVAFDGQEAVARAHERFRSITATSPGSAVISRIVPRNPIDFSSFSSLLSSRTSIRSYTAEEVSEGDLASAFSMARLAPSACNRQSTRFVVVKGKAILNLGLSIPGAKTFLQNIPCLIFVIGDLGAFPEPYDRHTIYLDGAIGTAYLSLAFKTLGYDTCVLNWPDISENNARIGRELPLSASERVVVCMAVGKADPDKSPLTSLREDSRKCWRYYEDN